jgi:integrase
MKMNLFKPNYTDRKGKKRTAEKWYLDFTTPDRRRHKLSGFIDRAATESLGRNILRLVSLKAGGETPKPELQQWIDGLPDMILRQLTRWGIIDILRAEMSKPLVTHVSDWQAAMTASGTTADHSVLQSNRVRRIIESCGFRTITDVSASRILTVIDGFRKSVDTADGEGNHRPKDIGPLSGKSKKYYLVAIKGFSRWMKKERRVSENPIDHLSIKINPDESIPRRALSADEICILLDWTGRAGVSFGMAGRERAILYRLAVESGLRSKELRRLRVSDIDLSGKILNVRAATTKSKRSAILPLKDFTVDILRGYLSGKMPSAAVFKMPSPHNIADMLRQDISNARSEWVQADPDGRKTSDFLSVDDSAGGRVDFHGLRHSFGSMLAAAGVHPKDAQTLMRHSTIDLTMNRYTHTYRGSTAAAIQNLPDFSTKQGTEPGRKTGTDDFVLDNCLDSLNGKTRNPAGSGGKLAISQDESKPLDSQHKTHSSAENETAPGGIRTPDLRIRNPLLYPTELRALRF